MCYEFHDGAVFAMARGSPKHSAIATNVTSLLNELLPDHCRPFNSDLKVYVASVNKSFHPDVSVAYRPITGPDEINAMDDPLVLIEVLFKATADYDRGEKFWYLSQLSSLKEDVLIEQDRWAVETRYRSSAKDPWTIAFFAQASASETAPPDTHTDVILQSLDLRLPLQQIYRNSDGL